MFCVYVPGQISRFWVWCWIGYITKQTKKNHTSTAYKSTKMNAFIESAVLQRQWFSIKKRPMLCHHFKRTLLLLINITGEVWIKSKKCVSLLWSCKGHVHTDWAVSVTQSVSAKNTWSSSGTGSWQEKRGSWNKCDFFFSYFFLEERGTKTHDRLRISTMESATAVRHD